MEGGDTGQAAWWNLGFRASAYPRRFDIPTSIKWNGGGKCRGRKNDKGFVKQVLHDRFCFRPFIFPNPQRLLATAHLSYLLGFSHRRPLNSTRPLGFSFADIWRSILLALGLITWLKLWARLTACELAAHRRFRLMPENQISPGAQPKTESIM